MNARFWEYINGDWVKITLHPGQELEHCVGEKHEEGVTWEANRWEHTGDTVIHECTRWGRDCDGRWETRLDFETSLEELDIRQRELNGEVGPVGWDVKDSSQRDYTAESAGY